MQMLARWHQRQKKPRYWKKLSCLPARRKLPPSRCNNNFNGVREYFTPPDLETMFKLHVEKAINLEPLCWWWWHMFGRRWRGLSDGENNMFSISDFWVKIHGAQSPISVFYYAALIWFPRLSLDSKSQVFPKDAFCFLDHNDWFPRLVLTSFLSFFFQFLQGLICKVPISLIEVVMTGICVHVADNKHQAKYAMNSAGALKSSPLKIDLILIIYFQ